MTDSLQSLYEITGDIKDANVILVNRGELRRLHAENEAMRRMSFDSKYDEVKAENEALRQLTSDLLSALEYHEEQTRPIHSTTVAIEAARAALARAGEVK